MIWTAWGLNFKSFSPQRAIHNYASVMPKPKANFVAHFEEVWITAVSGKNSGHPCGTHANSNCESRDLRQKALHSLRTAASQSKQYTTPLKSRWPQIHDLHFYTQKSVTRFNKETCAVRKWWLYIYYKVNAIMNEWINYIIKKKSNRNQWPLRHLRTACVFFNIWNGFTQHCVIYSVYCT